mgnify:CR=1 FL=1
MRQTDFIDRLDLKNLKCFRNCEMNGTPVRSMLCHWDGRVTAENKRNISTEMWKGAVLHGFYIGKAKYCWLPYE